MHRLLFAAISTVAVLAAAGSIPAAVAQPDDPHDYPYCLQGRSWGYPGLCQYSSYDQCMASASGTFSYCGINPRFAFAERPRRPYRPAY